MNRDTYEDFKTEVDRLFVDMFGLSAEHFVDWDYYSAWQEGLTPEQVFEDWKEDNYPWEFDL